MSTRNESRQKDPARKPEERPEGELGETVGDPDVLLEAPALNVEELRLESEKVRAGVSYRAELADFVKIQVGLEAEVDACKLEVNGVGAEAQMKARLDNVRSIFSRALSTLDAQPGLVRDLPGDPDHHRAEGAAGESSREGFASDAASPEPE